MKKIPYPSASTIVDRYELSEEAAKLFQPEMSPVAWIECLRSHSLWHDLVAFMAHALPVMDAIEWGRQALALRKADWTDEELALLDQIEQWLDDPDETARVRINQLGLRIGLKGGPSWLSQAVFWSGTGSIVEPDLPVVMPPPHLYSHAVAAAICVAAAIPQWDQFESFMENACLLGEAIASN